MIRKLKVIFGIVSNFLYFTGKPSYINPIFYLRFFNEGLSSDNLRKKNPNLYREICGIIFKSNSTGGEWSDYLNLYLEIKKHKPTNVLELGSGISSLVIAFALDENKELNNISGKLTSIEENEFYHNQIKKILPLKLKKYVTFFHCQRTECKYDDALGSFYKDLPQSNYDFVFIDGPTDRKDKYSEKTFNADIVNLIQNKKITKFNGILDQRVFSYLKYKRILKNVKLKYSVIKKITYLSSN